MTDSIFHSGDLQSGIGLAIQQQKLVACFVRQQDDPASKLWEEQWLVEGGLGDMIKEKAVLLKIEFGSQEAGFLSAFCSIDAAPTLVVIRNGQILAQLKSDIGEDEFRERLLDAVGLGSATEEDEATRGSRTRAESPSDAQEGAITSQEQAEDTAIPLQAQASVPPSVSPNQPASSQPSDLSTMFPDRAQRLESERQRRLEAETAALRERTERRRREEQAANSSPSRDKGKGKQRASSPTVTERAKARNDWVRQQKKKNDEAKSDRQRILAQIENDKQSRKAREQQAHKDNERPSTQATANDSSSPSGPFSRASAPSARGLGSVCALQLRLFDGSSLRGRFSPTSTLADAVRTYISTHAASSSTPETPNLAEIPYTFRQILAPQPSRSIEMSDEHRSLFDLGLCPSATLVLVPVAGYTEAYASSGAGGVLYRAFGAGTGLVGGAYNLAASVVGAVAGFAGGGVAPAAASEGPYMGGTGDEREASNAEGADMAGNGPAGKVRVKTLADQRAEAKTRGEAEFYNGNSLDFESRDDEERNKRKD